MSKPFLFSLGQTVATPGALRAIEEAHEVSSTFIIRHLRGDWGDLGDDDKRANDRALKDGSRIFSAYILPRTGSKIYVITEAEGDDQRRESTCVLLPEDY